MQRPVIATVAAIALCGPGLAAAQSADQAPKRVEEVRIVRAPGGGDQADVLFGGPDVAWFAMGAEPEAMLDGNVKGAPFTAEASTEFVQTLADGNRIVRQSMTSLARDGEGRTRREVRSASPDGTPRSSVTIADPIAATRYLLDPVKRTARTLPNMFFRTLHDVGGDVAGSGDRTMDVRVTRVPDDGAQPPPPPPPPPAGVNGDGAPKWVTREAQVVALQPMMEWTSDDVQAEDLGTRTIEGVEATGTRRTVTIEAGAIGNEQPIRIVSERWYSPGLKTVVLSKRSDPRSGEHTYRLSSILKGEPDPSLFQVPPDYTVEKGPEQRIHIERRP